MTKPTPFPSKNFVQFRDSDLTIHKTLSWMISIIGIINKVLLQWFFIRIQFRLNTNGNKQYDLNAICLMYGVVPLTGWSSPYKFLSWCGTLGA